VGFGVPLGPQRSLEGFHYNKVPIAFLAKLGVVYGFRLATLRYIRNHPDRTNIIKNHLSGSALPKNAQKN
jgi:hypothetical protein